MASIHPSAHVDPSAELGDVEIGPFAVVGPGVTLHDGVILDAHAVVLGRSVIGEGCRFHAFSCVGGEPQDLKYKGEDTRLIVGRDNTFREGVTVHRGTVQGGGLTQIGDGNLFMANSHIAHDCTVGSHCIFANSAALAGHVQVHDHVVFGGMAGVHQFCRIGRRAMVAAGAMAALDVPPFCIAQGDRARLYGLNLVGLRRAGFSKHSLQALRMAWREIFARQIPLKEAVVRVQESWGDVPEVVEMVEFLSDSRRGVCRAGGSPDLSTM